MNGPKWLLPTEEAILYKIVRKLDIIVVFQRDGNTTEMEKP